VTFHNRTGRQGARHNPRIPDREAVIRSAPLRNRALCAGIEPFVAAIAGVKAVPPQRHVWWPVVSLGRICLRCSVMEFSKGRV
jgi:hypothetical protein